MVVRAGAASMSGTAVQAGTNVYTGDRATTSANGHLQMKLGAAQVFLGGSTEAHFQENEHRVLIYLSRGSAGFTAEGDEAALLHVAGAWIRPQTSSLTQASVQVLGEREFLVSASRGPLDIVLDGETLVVPQNQTMRVSVPPADPDQDKEVEGVGKKEERKKRRRAIFIVFGATTGIVVPIVLYNTHPGRSGSTNAASPTVP